MEVGDTAVVVADNPRGPEDDEHEVALRTVVKIMNVVPSEWGDLYECTYYDCGRHTQVFYEDELEVIR